MLFICSSALVLSHSVWTADWRIVVTLLGWFMLTVSLLQLFFPRSMAWPMRVLPDSQCLNIVQIVLGVYLVYHGFKG